MRYIIWRQRLPGTNLVNALRERKRIMGIKENAANEMHGAIRSPKLLHFTQVNISREYLLTARHGRREIFS